MAEILAKIAGGLLTLLGYDGTDFRNVLVDAAGHLQVDGLTTALPTDAATQTTLAALLTELNAKLETGQLLIDGDKRLGVNAYGWDGTDPYIVKTDNQGRLVVVSEGVEADVLTAVYRQTITHTSNGSADEELKSTAVIEGTVRVVTHITAVDLDNDVGSIIIEIDDDVTETRILYHPAGLEDVGIEWDGKVYLDEDCYVSVVFATPSNNDRLHVYVQGYDMDAP